MHLSLFIDIDGTILTKEDKQTLLHPAISGVILFSRNFHNISQLKDLIAEIKSLKDPRLLVSVDQEGGNVQRFRQSFTKLPSFSKIGGIYQINPYLGKKIVLEHACIMVEELRSVGVDLSFTPVVDIGNKNSKVLKDRTFSENPEIVAELALYYTKVMKENGMIAVAKHFPGHGGVNEDSHFQLPIDKRELSSIWERDLLPYRELIKNDLQAVMMAHVIYETIDIETASYSKIFMKDILRKQLGFRGFVFSDDLSMKGAQKKGGITARAIAAMEAGCDILLICNDRASVKELLNSDQLMASMDLQRKILDNLKSTKLYGEKKLKGFSDESLKILV